MTLPPRVSLRGAGYRKTILDARKAEVGLAIEGGDGAEIADLTVWGASKTGVLVAGAANVALRRLRTTGGLGGVNFVDVTGGRIENVISDENRYGIVVSGGRGNAVVNCTVARNSSLGLSFPSGDGTLAFNNCIADCATGVFLGEAARRVRLDHNLYFALFVGKMAGQLGRKTLGDWQSLSGQDPHSVQLRVAFRDANNGDYRPAGTLPWSLERAATADWGTASCAGVRRPPSPISTVRRAPGGTMSGRSRLRRRRLSPGLPMGRFRSAPTPGSRARACSPPTAREVAYLFHNLPLPAGPHPFWLPSRDFEGRTIPAGTYEVRIVESALSWEYLRWVGDSGRRLSAEQDGRRPAVLVRLRRRRPADCRPGLVGGWHKPSRLRRGDRALALGFRRVVRPAWPGAGGR